MGPQAESEMLVLVDAHRNEILLRYFCTPNDRSTQVNGQIVYARFLYDRRRESFRAGLIRYEERP